MKINYVTSNSDKYQNAQRFFEKHSIEILQQELDISEIQSENPVGITLDKAQKAWNILKEPLFVNDASWAIPSLNGFPGAYMKYVNQWFNPDDFINLMRDKEDRTIILQDVIIYIDKNGHTIFTNEHKGTILRKKYSGEYRHPSDLVISLSKNGASIAQEVASKTFFIEGENKIWNEFAQWIKKSLEHKDVVSSGN